MPSLLLQCMIDINTELNPTVGGVERRTTWTYRESNVNLDITHPSITTITCPCCGCSLEFHAYPGLKFKDALRLLWMDNYGSCMSFMGGVVVAALSCYFWWSHPFGDGKEELDKAIAMSILFGALGLLVLLGCGSWLKQCLVENCNPQIVDALAERNYPEDSVEHIHCRMSHQLFYGTKNVTADRLGELEKRKDFYQ